MSSAENRKLIQDLRTISTMTRSIFDKSIENSVGYVRRQERGAELFKPILDGVLGKVPDGTVRPTIDSLLEKREAQQTKLMEDQTKLLEANNLLLAGLSAPAFGSIPPPDDSGLGSGPSGPPPPAYTYQEFFRTWDNRGATFNMDEINSFGILGQASVDIEAMKNDGKIILTLDGKSKEEGLTPGLAQLLLHPYVKSDKIATTKLFNLVNSEDKEKYLSLLKFAESPMKSEKANFAKGKQRGKGFSPKNESSFIRQSYMVDDGKFGRIRIDRKELKGGYLQAHDIATDKIVARFPLKNPQQILDLLTKKRISAPQREIYAHPEVQEEYQEILKLGNVLPKNSFKYRQAVAPVIVATTDEALEQLNVVLGQIEAGNSSSALKNQLIGLIDLLLKNRKITRRMHQEITEEYIGT